MPEDIVNIQGAAKILGEKAGRTIPSNYVRELRRRGRLRAINEEENTRAKLFYRADVEAVKIGHARERGVRHPRKKQSPATSQNSSKNS